ncbi:hypothetical protein BL241_03595 [Ralstonia solanacearum]|uniref:Putative membrane protein n=1 Tax=Ralstonia solanacearum TaxID=305 RepID=A0A0S4U426_RALSL|nr:hypothetical protein [Ralstonia solanacearum]NKG09633.1 hypothetical protein [Ralstonia solanacearum]OIT13622.1 hypothetical protein BL241_03595 [Ralstonia solanacearum]CUV17003.1 putative membrane protein [Ralstonia solanacearum]
MKTRALTKLCDSSFSPRNSPFWYGWKIRMVWMIAAISGLLSDKTKANCQNWATMQAYRLGWSDYGVHFNTPRFSRNEKLANAYDNGAYDFWIGCTPHEDTLSYLF